MISKEEIQKIADQKQLGIDIIEKDYIISWVLAGINQHPATKDSWVFKGGTCLKKCYFRSYRFSEDLDFTIREVPNQLTEKYYKNIFTEIAKWIYGNSGIVLPEQRIEFETFQNKRNSVSVQGKLAYRGPIKGNLNIIRLPRLKLDLTLDESLLLEPVVKKVEHAYSDVLDNNGIEILAYTYEELFAEKLRALMERLRPRDLYDVVHLFQQKGLDVNSELLKRILQKKCDLRSVPFPKIELIKTHNNRKLLESEWQIQLKHQLFQLISFEYYFNELDGVLKWIAGKGS